MPDHRARLAAIKRFDQLVTYLRDDMGWPIEGDDFEEITFDYTPDELGIDAANRAKIQQIKRLRPLAANQPWGIFFVRFEPKRLPVVAEEGDPSARAGRGAFQHGLGIHFHAIDSLRREQAVIVLVEGVTAGS